MNTAPGYVYFIALEPYKDEFIKVGWVKNDPRRRLSELQTGCPYKLKLIACAPGSPADERWAHSQLSRFRARGEWFQGLNLDEIHTFGMIEGSSLGDLVEAAKSDDSMFGSVLVMTAAA